jgi:hypothetical protein
LSSSKLPSLLSEILDPYYNYVTKMVPDKLIHFLASSTKNSQPMSKMFIQLGNVRL